MRSFAGRDILSLKDFERNEFFHVFEVADELEPIARSRRRGLSTRCIVRRVAPKRWRDASLSKSKLKPSASRLGNAFCDLE